MRRLPESITSAERTTLAQPTHYGWCLYCPLSMEDGTARCNSFPVLPSMNLSEKGHQSGLVSLRVPLLVVLDVQTYRTLDAPRISGGRPLAQA